MSPRITEDVVALYPFKRSSAGVAVVLNGEKLLAEE